MIKCDEIPRNVYITYDIDGVDEYITDKYPAEYIKKVLNRQYGADDNGYIDTSFGIFKRMTFADIVFSRSCINNACYPYKVIYSGPCTIVFFQNGTKEIVRMRPDEKCDDREKDVMYAILKHAIGEKNLKKIFNSAKDYRDEESN